MTVDELQVLITANTNELRKEINNTPNTRSGLKKSAEKGTSGVQAAFSKLKTGIIALGIGKVIKDSITSGMDAIESDSLFSTVMGENADAVRSWSNEVADALGLSAVNMQKNIGVIYNMTSSMGVAGDNALKMSKGVSVLAEDMASFYNLDSTEAFNKLRAGLTGETEPLKALGILVDENTVKQTAYSAGIAEVGAELTNEQKVLARYTAILNQTSTAQGDLARTLTSPSNQLRSLKQNVQNLGIAFSNFLMPVIQAVLPWLNALAKVATQALNSLASFMGFTGGGGASTETQKISDNVGGLGSGLDDASKKAKKLKQSLAGFDEMNVLQDNSSDDSGSSGGASVGATASVGFDLSEYNTALDKVKSNTDELVEKIKSAFSAIGKGIKFDNLIKSFNNLKKAVEPLTAKIWEGLKWAVDNILNPLAAWTIEDAIPAFFDSLSVALTNIGLIDFTALQEKLLILSDSIAPFVDNVGAGLDWFLQNVLVPLAAWTIEDIVPAFLDGLSGAIDIVNMAIDNVKPLLSWLWESILEPIAKWTGGVIASVLNAIGDALKWIGQNEAAVGYIEGMAIAIGLVSAALGIYKGITILATAVSTAFGTVMAFITSPITLVTVAIGIVIATVILLVKHWDTVKEVAAKCWEGIKNAWNAAGEWFNKYIVQPIAKFFTGLWDGLKSGASKVWEGIKGVFSGIGSFFSGVWEGIKGIFSKAGKFITDTVGGAFKSAINAVLSGAVKIINGFISAINFAIDIINAIPGVEISRLDKLEVPKFAQGGVVDRPTLGVFGEAGTEAVVPLERNLGWLDKMSSMLAEKLGGGTGSINLVVKLGEEAIFDKFIEYGREKSFETNGEVVFV